MIIYCVCIATMLLSFVEPGVCSIMGLLRSTMSDACECRRDYLQYLTAPQDKFGVYPYTLTKSGGRGHGRVQVMTGHETTIRNNSGRATHCTLVSLVPRPA